MNPTVRKLHEELAEVRSEMERLSAMECSTPEEIQARETEMESLVARSEDLTARSAKEEAFAAARAKVEAVKTSTNVAGIVAPVAAQAPIVRSAPTLGKVQGFETAEAAEKVGRYLRSLARGEVRGDFSTATEEPNSHGGLSPTYDGKGAELVIHELYRGILNMLSYASTCVQVVSTFPVNTNGLELPIADMVDEAEFYLENCEIKPVLLKTQRAVLDLKKLGARAQVSNELLEDAYISVAQLVAQNFAYSFAKKIDRTWLQGDVAAGVDGLIGKIPAANVVTAPTNLTPATLASVVSTCNPNAGPRCWIVSPEGWGKIMAVSASAIGANIADTVRPVVYGSPVYQCLELPPDTLALYGDFKMACAMGYKPSGLQVAASADRAFEYDQVVYRATARYAWNSHSPQYVVRLAK
jgi:HK97 family phage major capsid protein